MDEIKIAMSYPVLFGKYGAGHMVRCGVVYRSLKEAFNDKGIYLELCHADNADVVIIDWSDKEKEEEIIRRHEGKIRLLLGNEFYSSDRDAEIKWFPYLSNNTFDSSMSVSDDHLSICGPMYPIVDACFYDTPYKGGKNIYVALGASLYENRLNLIDKLHQRKDKLSFPSMNFSHEENARTMSRCSAAVTLGGVSAWECYTAGIPQVILPAGEIEEMNARYISAGPEGVQINSTDEVPYAMEEVLQRGRSQYRLPCRFPFDEVSNFIIDKLKGRETQYRVESPV